MLSCNKAQTALTHDDYIDKVYKADYVNLQMEFTESLTQLSGDLKGIVNPVPDI